MRRTKRSRRVQRGSPRQSGLWSVGARQLTFLISVRKALADYQPSGDELETSTVPATARLLGPPHSRCLILASTHIAAPTNRLSAHKPMANTPPRSSVPRPKNKGDLGATAQTAVAPRSVPVQLLADCVQRVALGTACAATPQTSWRTLDWGTTTSVQSPPRVEFHDCFTSQLEAVASGELNVRKIEATSRQFPCGLVSGTELLLMKDLPVGRLEDQLRLSRGILGEVRTPAENPYVQWLFRLALSKDRVDGHTCCWKFSFCEGRWINFADWVHCVKCEWCHRTLGAIETGCNE